MQKSVAPVPLLGSSHARYPVDERGYTDTRGAAEYYGVSTSKMNKDRHFSVGAEWIRIGSAIRYSFAALDAHADKNRRGPVRERDG